MTLLSSSHCPYGSYSGIPSMLLPQYPFTLFSLPRIFFPHFIHLFCSLLAYANFPYPPSQLQFTEKESFLYNYIVLSTLISEPFPM